MSNIKTTQVEFKGKATEYFGIWIVNLLLSLITFGIYSAWAKVRRKKYFYHNTLIDNVGFDYHAKPIGILKGRIIAFAAFMGYSFSGQIHPFFPLVFVLLFFIALPWLVVRSSMFNARNTSHRGLRFDFIGKVGEAFRVFVLLPIMTVFTLYLALPYVAHQKNKFLMGSHKFGLSEFDMKAKVGGFYRAYMIFLIVPLIGVLAAIAIPAYKNYTDKAAQMSANSIPLTVGFSNGATDNMAALAENEFEIEEEQLEDEPYRVERVYSNAVSEPVQDIAYPEDVSDAVGKLDEEKSFEELMEESMRANEKAREDVWKEMFKNPKMLFGSFTFFLAYIVVIFAFLGYIKTRVGNLVWNKTTLDHLAFKSSLRARDYIWIYLTNIIAIALTFGLATPWAHVRLARYRASKLQIIGDVDFDQFVGEKKEAVKATGEEIADFFDADFSFG